MLIYNLMIQMVDVYLVLWVVKRGICLFGLQIEQSAGIACG